METLKHNRITDIRSAEAFLEAMIGLRNALFSGDSEVYHRIIDDLYKLTPSPNARDSALLSLKEVAALTGKDYQFVIKKAKGDWRYATVYIGTKMKFYESEVPRLIEDLNNTIEE